MKDILTAHVLVEDHQLSQYIQLERLLFKSFEQSTDFKYCWSDQAPCSKQSHFTRIHLENYV